MSDQETQNSEEIVGEQEVAAEPTCEEKLKEAEDKYLRVHADFENIKKRLEKEKYQAIDYASEKFAKDLLPVIDTLELALGHMQSGADMEKLKEGVQLTLDNLTKVFERHGIKSVSHEEGFDPNLHEAVMQSASDEHEDNQVIAVLQKGYMLKDRILRPSLVNVCKK